MKHFNSFFTLCLGFVMLFSLSMEAKAQVANHTNTKKCYESDCLLCCLNQEVSHPYVKQLIAYYHLDDDETAWVNEEEGIALNYANGKITGIKLKPDAFAKAFPYNISKEATLKWAKKNYAFKLKEWKGGIKVNYGEANITFEYMTKRGKVMKYILYETNGSNKYPRACYHYEILPKTAKMLELEKKWKEYEEQESEKVEEEIVEKKDSFGCYEGNCDNGIGRYLYKNGDEYYGSFVNGKPCGKGVMAYANGEIYSGYFLNGVYYGWGELMYKNSKHYKGYWVNGKKYGEGTVLSAFGEKIKSGYYYNDEFVGEKAKCMYNDAEIFNTICKSMDSEFAGIYIPGNDTSFVFNTRHRHYQVKPEYVMDNFVNASFAWKHQLHTNKIYWTLEYVNQSYENTTTTYYLLYSSFFDMLSDDWEVKSGLVDEEGNSLTRWVEA